MTVALTVTVIADNAASDAVLTITSTVNATTDSILRNEPGQSKPVRVGPQTLVANQPHTVRDLEVPLGVEVTYTVTTVAGASDTSLPVTVDGDGSDWLIHLGQPSLSMKVTVASYPETMRGTRVSVLPIIGATLPVSQSDKPLGADGPLTIITSGAAERNNLGALLADGSPLLFQTPKNEGVGNRYISVVGIKTRRPSPLATEQTRYTTLDTVEVNADASVYQPPGGFYTWDQLAIDQSTWNSVPVKWPMWREVPLGQSAAGVLAGL